MARSEGYAKTVYIVGAGFSTPAGGLGQDAILRNILEFEAGRDPTLAAAQERLIEFFQRTLRVDLQRIGEIHLEDIYTPLDRCLADHASFRGLSRSDMEAVRFYLDYMIAKVIEEGFRARGTTQDYVRKFADFLVAQAAGRAALAARTGNAEFAKSWDPFSIISLNWDILLDTALYEIMKSRHPDPVSDYDPFGVVDYGCYVSSYTSGERRVRPALWSLGARGYNVKLLKLHGSVNWLQCTNCQRLFVSFAGNLILRSDERCRHCQEHGIDALLRTTLVMPTFLKDLSNFQLKLIWQNAGVELMEASRLVFIGYSLSLADFEFRQLLTRMVHPAATIDVVLYRPQATDRVDDEEAFLREEQKFNAARKRFREFFPCHELNYQECGVLQFMSHSLASSCARFSELSEQAN